MYRTLSRAALCILLIFVSMYTAKSQCPAATPLVINSVTVTESRCTASGTATLLVTGGSAPYTYSIKLASGCYFVVHTSNENTVFTQIWKN